MKAAILALAALVSTVQTVGWVECCCILICKHHNDPCKDECKEKPQASGHDCCEKPTAPAPQHDHDKRCSHVEPSSEILTQDANLHPATPLESIELPLVNLLPSPADSLRTLPLCEATRGSPPLLHLLFGSLLI